MQERSIVDTQAKKMFEDMFKGMPIEQAKALIMDRVTAAKDWKTLGNAITTGLRICALNS